MPAGRNRHIVDQLADLRFRRKSLEEEEAKLRFRVLTAMGENDELVGDEFVAFRENLRMPGAIDPAKLRAAGINPERYRKRGYDIRKVVIEPRFVGGNS